MPRRPTKTGIYQILNLINNKCYVGSATNIYNRWSTHKTFLCNNKHHSITLQRAYNKYGEQNIQFIILEECSLEELQNREQYYIDIHNSFNNGYNLQPFARSSRGFKHSIETKEKFRQSQLKLCENPNERKRRSARAKKQHAENNLGIHTRKKPPNIEAISKKQTELWKNPEYREKMIEALNRRKRLGIKNRKRT